MDQLGYGLDVGFIDFQNGQFPATFFLAMSQKGSYDPLGHVGPGRVGQNIAVFFFQGLGDEGRGHGLAVGPRNDNGLVVLAQLLKDIWVKLHG